MSIKLRKRQASDGWPKQFKLEDPTFGEMTVTLRKPTGGELLKDRGIGHAAAFEGDPSILSEMGERRLSHRIETSVVDWDGIVDDDGKKIPYSFDNLKLLMAQHTAVIEPLFVAVGQAYRGLTDEELGKYTRPLTVPSEPNTGASEPQT